MTYTQLMTETGFGTHLAAWLLIAGIAWGIWYLHRDNAKQEQQWQRGQATEQQGSPGSPSKSTGTAATYAANQEPTQRITSSHAAVEAATASRISDQLTTSATLGVATVASNGFVAATQRTYSTPSSPRSSGHSLNNDLSAIPRQHSFFLSIKTKRASQTRQKNANGGEQK